MRGRKKQHTSGAAAAAAAAASLAAHDAASLAADERLLEVTLRVPVEQLCGDGSGGDGSAAAAAAAMRSALDRLLVDVALQGEHVTCVLGERAAAAAATPSTTTAAAVTTAAPSRTNTRSSTRPAAAATAAAATMPALPTSAAVVAAYDAPLLQRRITVTLPSLAQLFAADAPHTLDLFAPAPPQLPAVGKPDAVGASTATSAAATTTSSVRTRKTPALPPSSASPLQPHGDARARRPSRGGAASATTAAAVSNSSSGGSSGGTNKQQQQRDVAVSRGACVARVTLPLHALLQPHTTCASCALTLRVADLADAGLYDVARRNDKRDSSRVRDRVVCCTVELHCRNTPLLTPTLLHAYRPVCIALDDVADVVRLVTANNNNNNSNNNNNTYNNKDDDGSTCRSDDADVVVAEVVVHFLDHVWRVPVHVADADDNNDDDDTTTTVSRATRRTQPARQWRGVCFLGAHTPLDVYRRLDCTNALQLTVRRCYAHEHTADDDDNDEQHGDRRSRAPLDDGAARTVGAAALSLRELLTHQQTTVQALVQLLPQRSSGSSGNGILVTAATRPPQSRQQLPRQGAAVPYADNCLTAACMLGIRVDCYVPLPLPHHIVIDDNNNNNDDVAVVTTATRCTATPCSPSSPPRHLTRAVLLMPYAAPWLHRTLSCLIHELCKLPAARTADDDVHLYTPPAPHDGDNHDNNDSGRVDDDDDDDSDDDTHNVDDGGTSSGDGDGTRSSAATAAAAVTATRSRSHDVPHSNRHAHATGVDARSSSGDQHNNNDDDDDGGLTSDKHGGGGSNNNSGSSSSHSSDGASVTAAVDAQPSPSPALSAFAAQPFAVVTPRAISGFEVMDATCRIVCVEGPVADVHALLVAVVDAAVASGYIDEAVSSTPQREQQRQLQPHDGAASASSSSLRVLFNAELFAPQRRYAAFPPLVTPPAVVTFASREEQQQQEQQQQATSLHAASDMDMTEAEASGTSGRIHRIRLAQTLQSIASQQSYLLHRTLSDACLRCLARLRVLMTCTSMRDVVARDALPTADELISVERSFGQTLDLVDLFATHDDDDVVAAAPPPPLRDTSVRAATAVASATTHDATTTTTLANKSSNNNTNDRNDDVDVTRLRACDVGRIVTFDGVLCATATASHSHDDADNDNSDGDDDDASMRQRGKRTRARALARVARRFARVCYLRPCAPARGAVLCAFADAATPPRGASRYAVEAQVVQYDGVRLLYVLATRSLARSQTHSGNAAYDALLRQRRRRRHTPAVASTQKTTTTTRTAAATTHTRPSSVCDSDSDGDAHEALDDRWLAAVTTTTTIMR